MKFTSAILACLLPCLAALSAVPDYKAFKGTGGITIVSNPPTGDITIDGSGISAGALPSFALTNNQSSDVRFAADVKIDGQLTNANVTYLLDNVFMRGGNLFNNGSTRSGNLISTNFLINEGWTQNAGSTTNKNGSGIALEDSGNLALFLSGANASAGVYSSNANFNIGFFGGPGITIDNTGGAGRFAWSSAPFGDLGYASAGYGWNIITGTNGWFHNVAVRSAGAGKLLRTDSNSNITEVTIGSNLSFDGTTLSATGGSGTPGGQTANLQVNNGGTFVGSTNIVVDVTNGTMRIGSTVRPEALLQLTNSSSAAIFIDGVQSAALKRMGIRPSTIGTEATTGAAAVNTNWTIVAGGVTIGTITSTGLVMAAGMSLQAPYANLIQGYSSNWRNTNTLYSHVVGGSVFSNAPAAAIDGTGVWEIYPATNSMWTVNFTGNYNLNFNSFPENTITTVIVTNNASTITWEDPEFFWIGQKGATTTYPTLQGGVFVIHFQRIGGVTNAWIVSEPEFQVAAAGTIALNTNSATGVVTITNAVLAATKQSAAATLFIDANVAERHVISNRVSAATTVVLTNTVDGNRMSIILLGEASGGTDRTVTIIAHLGQLVADLDTFGVALAASKAITLTNGNAVEISGDINRLNGTNTLGLVSRQFRY